MRPFWPAMMFMLALQPATAAQDEFRIIQLEQDVRNLERQVQTLSRQIGELAAQLGRSGDFELAPSASSAQQPSSSAWLVAANWDRIRPGMSELAVINTLGSPASMRVDNGRRVLLYAMEIGSSGFLSGSVTLADHEVVEVEKPVLK